MNVDYRDIVSTTVLPTVLVCVSVLCITYTYMSYMYHVMKECAKDMENGGT